MKHEPKPLVQYHRGRTPTFNRPVYGYTVSCSCGWSHRVNDTRARAESDLRCHIRNQKVWGGNFDGRKRLIVAAPTKAQAIRAFGISSYTFASYGNNTESPAEVEAATARPGIVLEAGDSDGVQTFVEHSRWEPLPDIDCRDLMTVAEFKDGVDSSGYTDWDGYGRYSNGKMMSSIMVHPSEVTRSGLDPRFTHVVWFNK